MGLQPIYRSGISSDQRILCLNGQPSEVRRYAGETRDSDTGHVLKALLAAERSQHHAVRKGPNLPLNAADEWREALPLFPERLGVLLAVSYAEAGDQQTRPVFESRRQLFRHGSLRPIGIPWYIIVYLRLTRRCAR
jgi:hypothetical protein